VSPEKRAILKDLVAERRIHVARDALTAAHPQVREHFGNSLKRVEESAVSKLCVFPTALLRLMRDHPRACVSVVAEMPEVRRPGGYFRELTEAKVASWGLRLATGALEEEVTHLLDHLLGSNGEGGNLSEGNGATEALAEVGRELLALYEDKANKYSEYGDRNPREFLAQWVRAYLTAEHEFLWETALEMYTWLRDKWFSDTFWREVLQ